ncbi:hypothetical protein [Flavivirga algicola]|uniref:Lipoprotein n=1 Tax=Flavivirga algicola TaxID=2729136 RepID=A0ABX1RQT0_9FLAO|nr:hypothetical protein [Flavivirga algicola]NMH85907.1 hypothetical protein [Flavivirga algicola]
MKTIITIILLSFTGLCSSQSITSDHKLHFGVGALISATTYTVVYSATKNKKKAFWYSLGSSTLAGLTKEVLDSSKENNRFDTGELAATSLGGLTASATISLFVGKNKNKKLAKIALVN